MTKFNKWLKLTIPTVTALSAAAFVVACAPSTSTPSVDLSAKLLASLKADDKAAALKTSLAGYSVEEMEIIANKQEITAQSRELIKAFNEFYGTKLTFTQVGGTTDIGQFFSTKFASGPQNVLLVSAGSITGFQQIAQHLIDSPASKMLANDNTTEGEFVVGEKHFMPATIESIGVIYNRDTFTKAKITVFEGQNFSEATNKPATVTKPVENYNGTVLDGENLYVFTDDLTAPGYQAIVSKLKATSINPVYSTSKAPSGNIWPLTNHLLGAVVNAQTNLQPNDPKLQIPEEMMNLEIVNTMKQALDIYGHNEAYNRSSNSVDLAMTSVAAGTFAMTQNGTWSSNQIKTAKADANVGFLPMPVFNKTDQTAMLYRQVSQRWAATTVANDSAKLKTVQLFLQFLYQTKSGIEFSSDEMQINSPYKKIEGFTLQLNDKLAASSKKYQGADVGTVVDNYFLEGFNNSNTELVAVTNGGFAGGEADKTKLLTELNRLKTATKINTPN